MIKVKVKKLLAISAICLLAIPATASATSNYDLTNAYGRAIYSSSISASGATGGTTVSGWEVYYPVYSSVSSTYVYKDSAGVQRSASNSDTSTSGSAWAWFSGYRSISITSSHSGIANYVGFGLYSTFNSY